MTAMQPGIHEIPHDAYHADCCPVPSLSASAADVLLTQTPRHAWTAHPRLNPAFEREMKAEFDLGEAAHALIVGEGRGIQVIDADSYRTAAAKAARDEARAAGRIPILTEKMAAVTAMADAARRQLERHEAEAFLLASNLSERTLIWQEGPTWLRARPDRMSGKGFGMIWDYKTTGGTAHPDAFARKIYDMGYDVQAAFYLRGLRKITGIADGEFHFIVQETEPPYALAVVALTPAALGMAERKVERAIAIWRECMAANLWPGYPARVCYVDPPAYAEKSWLEREARDEAEPSAASIKAMIQWQSPIKGEAE